MQDQLEAIWDQILKITAVFVTPNWGDPIGWLPVLLVVGVVGPLLSILVLFWVWYLIRKPRVRYEYADASRPAPRDAAGDYLFPTGEPHCPRDGLDLRAARESLRRVRRPVAGRVSQVPRRACRDGRSMRQLWPRVHAATDRPHRAPLAWPAARRRRRRLIIPRPGNRSTARIRP